MSYLVKISYSKLEKSATLATPEYSLIKDSKYINESNIASIPIGFEHITITGHNKINFGNFSILISLAAKHREQIESSMGFFIPTKSECLFFIKSNFRLATYYIPHNLSTHRGKIIDGNLFHRSHQVVIPLLTTVPVRAKHYMLYKNRISFFV